MQKTMMIAASAVLLTTGSIRVNGFTNTLTDASKVAAYFQEHLGPDGTFSYSATPLTGYTTAGATLGYHTADTDEARSYLATDFTGYANYSWTAHLTVETPPSEKNYLFLGLGQGEPNKSYHNEPTTGERVLLRFASGKPGYLVELYANDTPVLNEDWLGDPGYDIWMIHDPVAQTITFKIDAWNDDGVLNGVDRIMTMSTADLDFNDSNARIFFGGNATATFSNFSVTAPPEPERTLGIII